jgi:hypothetical protein
LSFGGQRKRGAEFFGTALKFKKKFYKGLRNGRAKARD